MTSTSVYNTKELRLKMRQSHKIHHNFIKIISNIYIKTAKSPTSVLSCRSFLFSVAFINTSPAVSLFTRRRSSSPAEVWWSEGERKELQCQASCIVCTIGCEGCVCVWGGEARGQIPDGGWSWRQRVTRRTEGCVDMLDGHLWKILGTIPKVLFFFSFTLQ